MGDDNCKSCQASRHCKSVLLSRGFDLVGAMVEDLAQTLDPDQDYPDLDVSDREGGAEVIQILIRGGADAVLPSS